MFLEERGEREIKECFSCEAIFAVEHEMDEEEYEIQYCPFCAERMNKLDIDDWSEDE